MKKCGKVFRKYGQIVKSHIPMTVRRGGGKLLVSRRLASCKTFALPWRSLPFIRQNSDCVHALTPVEKERDRGKESND